MLVCVVIHRSESVFSEVLSILESFTPRLEIIAAGTVLCDFGVMAEFSRLQDEVQRLMTTLSAVVEIPPSIGIAEVCIGFGERIRRGLYVPVPIRVATSAEGRLRGRGFAATRDPSKADREDVIKMMASSMFLLKKCML